MEEPAENYPLADGPPAYLRSDGTNGSHVLLRNIFKDSYNHGVVGLAACITESEIPGVLMHEKISLARSNTPPPTMRSLFRHRLSAISDGFPLSTSPTTSSGASDEDPARLAHSPLHPYSRTRYQYASTPPSAFGHESYPGFYLSNQSDASATESEYYESHASFQTNFRARNPELFRSSAEALASLPATEPAAATFDPRTNATAMRLYTLSRANLSLTVAPRCDAQCGVSRSSVDLEGAAHVLGRLSLRPLRTGGRRASGPVRRRVISVSRGFLS